jgi:hypothetical protein
VKRLLSVALLLLLCAARGDAWPAETITAIGRDARRLLPQSLSRLIGRREAQLELEAARLSPPLLDALGRDIASGTLRPETTAALDAELGRAVQLLREQRVSEGLARFGGLLRVAADLSDPVLAAGAEGWPPELAREYYALFAANVERMPVVLDDPATLELRREDLPGLWQSLLDRSRGHAPVIRRELFRGGRVVSHARLDYRSPAWAVASLSYSRAVSATAGSWLAAWRAAKGDPTRRGRARLVAPREAPAGGLARDRRSPRPEAR